jgi:KDO2-lipid IV(A) lauroyltransferase
VGHWFLDRPGDRSGWDSRLVNITRGAQAERATLVERLTAMAYMAAWRTVRRLPQPVADGVFRRIADTMWRRHGRGVVQLERNLARVLGTRPDSPRVRELSRDALRSYLRYWCETFRLPGYSQPDVLAAVVPSGEEHLRAAQDVGIGVVLALPHCGNWDLAGAWLVARGTPFTTAAEQLRPACLYQAFVDYRTGLGMDVLPLDGRNGAAVFSTLAARLRDGKLVCLVADRDLTESGVAVEFFGDTARMPGGAAALSVATGAALVPLTLWYEGPRMRLAFHPPIEQPTWGTRAERIAAMTQRLADTFAHSIAAHPADWHMLQRIWPADARLRHVAAAARGPRSTGP